MIYENIKKIGDERNLSIASIEKLAGVGNGVIGKWRTMSPNIDTLSKIADALDVTIDELVNGGNE